LAAAARARAAESSRRSVSSSGTVKGADDEFPDAKRADEAHDEFRDAKRADGEPLTYKHYVDKLLPFYERFGERVIASLSKADGIACKSYLMKDKEWKKGKTTMKGLGACSVNHYLRAAKTFLNWCASPGQRHITYNPRDAIEHLKEHGRERLVTDEEFAALLKHCVTCRYAAKVDHKQGTCYFCRSDDLVETKKGEKLVLSSTRHTRITEMFVQGNEQHVVMAESGHVVPMTTERYKQLADDDVTNRVRQTAHSEPAGGAG
jgi:integrase